MTRCPPDLHRYPVMGELLNGRPMCQAHYCGWCCGCAVCRSADVEWKKRETPAPRKDSEGETK